MARKTIIQPVDDQDGTTQVDMGIACGVTADCTVTLDERCNMTTDVEPIEIQFHLHDADNKHLLCFDRPAFARYMRLACVVIERLGAARPVPFVVTADDPGSDENPVSPLGRYPEMQQGSMALLAVASNTCSAMLTRMFGSMQPGHQHHGNVLDDRNLGDRSDRGTTESSVRPSSGFCVVVYGSAALTCEVIEDQIEFRFGDDRSGLHLFLNLLGFVKFIRLACMVTRRLQTARDGEVFFTVESNEE